LVGARLLVDRALDAGQTADQLSTHVVQLVGAQQPWPDAGLHARRRSDAWIIGFNLTDRSLQNGDLLAQRTAPSGRRVERLARGRGRYVDRSGNLARIDTRFA
jgi:hypothetical protein